MTIEIKMDEKGRILIPKEIREQLNLIPGENLSFKIEMGRLIILKPKKFEEFLNDVEEFQQKLKETTKEPISTDKLF